MCRDPARSGINDAVVGSFYTGIMILKRVLMGCAILTASVAGMPLASAQNYPPPPGYTGSLQPAYPQPGSYAADPRRVPDFEALEDDEGPGSPGSTTLSTPGYPQPGYPQGGPPPQVVNRQPVPQGPILSPDDPRYGRPPGAPPLYSDRVPPADAYRDGYPRPPGAVEGSMGTVPQGAPRPASNPVGNDGRPVSLSALPADEQPEIGPRKELPERLRRQEVAYQTKEPAGTIIVDTPNTQLYYILGNGRAIRYGVRVGRDGFTWTGVQKITRKAEWPDWHPPPEMIERQPYLPRFMAGGDGNPLGARAMYLGATVYRIHGTNQPSTIGKFVSSGCIGMLNEDVSDLFDRVKVGTRVVVLPGGPPPGDVAASAQPAPGTGAGYGPGASAQVGGAVNVQSNAAIGIPNQGPTVVPPLPAPVTVR
jgi:lipoprotein-anchoring transpeptidase ErfK/SrfK